MIYVQPDNVTGARNATLLRVGYEILARRSKITAFRIDDVTFLSDGTPKSLLRGERPRFTDKADQSTKSIMRAGRRL